MQKVTSMASSIDGMRQNEPAIVEPRLDINMNSKVIRMKERNAVQTLKNTENKETINNSQ
jgi:hypothetical protein